MLISKNEFDNLTEILVEQFENWTMEGLAKKFEEEYETNYGENYSELESICTCIISDIAQELNLEIEE